MKILIIGGTGILSTDFTNKTTSCDNEVYILNRGRNREFINNKAKLIVSDIRKETVEEIREKIKDNFDVVVDFLTFDILQLKKVLKIIDNKFHQYVFISSATVYKKKNDAEVISEKTDVGNDKWSYAYNKYLCEQYLKKLNINYTIIRPYVTYGDSRIPFPIIPDGYHYTLIKRILENKPIVLYNDGSAICTITHTIDFAEILYKLLCNENAYRNIFNITSNCIQSWKTVYLTICNILDRNPNYISVDLDNINKYMPEFVDLLVGDKGTDMVFDNSKVIKAIGGYTFTIDLETGLKRTIDFYLKNDFMKKIDYKWDGRVDYMIKKMTGLHLECLHSDFKEKKNNKMKYYIMKYFLTRNVFDIVKRIK